MATTAIPEYPAQDHAESWAEREELEWLLTSGVLGRSGNLTRVLRYTCEERFAGRAHLIRESSIATEALGRRADFDPQTDTIVRVTVHSLRKRLMEVYQNEGRHRPVRLVMPPGRYAPDFVTVGPASPSLSVAASDEPVALIDIREETARPASIDLLSAPAAYAPAGRGKVLRWSVSLLALAGLIALTVWAVRHQQWKKLQPVESAMDTAALPLPAPQGRIHALMGTHRAAYTDHSGETWATGNYCQEGANLSVPNQRIQGTEDGPLYLGGVRGIAHCVFPVPKGLYEVHFYFAEASDLPAATRVASLSINAGAPFGVDVVDDAGGDGIATSRVATGVAPENDGSIHVDFISEVSPLNAVEILPAPSAKLLPVRIVASDTPFVDGAKQVWASDRYFSGGRHGLPAESASQAGLGIYGSDRVGRFQYVIPAVPMAHYRVNLYFREPWFGNGNGGNGGPGSRVFNVACNGVLLLNNFDILAEGGSAPMVKTFDVRASAAGRIELSFLPVVNYAVISAIEVLPED